MDRRRMAIFIAINVVVSATVVLLLLSAWEARQRDTAPVPTIAVEATRPRGAPSTPLPQPTQAPPTATPSPTASGPFTYLIEEGDTLGALALEFDVALEDLLEANDLSEDALLSVGQEIIIPIGGLAALESTPDTDSTDDGPAFVTIREIISGSLRDEVLILTNLGDAVNLAGWTLSDGKNHRFTFPDLTLFPDAEIEIHTTSGTNTPVDLYWGESEARWDESGTVAYLRDAGGKLVATYRVP